MTTSVIEDLENEDTSFSKRYSDTTSHLQLVSSWVREVEWACHEARSTVGSNNWDQSSLKTDFFIEIETTKKAISDKRFEEMLSTPPTGWILMGMTKSRKEGVIKAQYIKEDNYSITPVEVINERYRWVVTDRTERLVKMIASKEEQMEDTISTLSQKTSNGLEVAVSNIKQWRGEINLLNTIKDVFSQLGKNDRDLTSEREYFATHNYHWELSNIFQQLMSVPTLSRYVWRDLGLFDPKSTLFQLVNWRETDDLPHSSHIYSL